MAFVRFGRVLGVGRRVVANGAVTLPVLVETAYVEMAAAFVAADVVRRWISLVVWRRRRGVACDAPENAGVVPGEDVVDRERRGGH